MINDDFDHATIEEDYEIEELSAEELQEISLDDVEELTDVEAEDTTGGGSYVFQSIEGIGGFSDAQKKGYSKHCGGVRKVTSSPSIIVPEAGARLGIIDRIYVTSNSIPVKVAGKGTSNLTVTRAGGHLGLATLEIWGHQPQKTMKIKLKNGKIATIGSINRDINYMVVRVMFK